MISKKSMSYLTILSCSILLLVSIPVHTNSPQKFLTQILTPKNGQILKALFTPKDDIRQTVINLIKNEKKAIKLAVYFFTDNHMANSLIDAHNREIKVEIITDAKHVETCSHTKIFELARAGIPVYVFENKNKYGIFHHKFMYCECNLAQAPILLTGSFNFTTMAQEQNQENVIITDNSDINTSFLNQFNFLKHNQTIPLSKFIKQQKLKILA